MVTTSYQPRLANRPPRPDLVCPACHGKAIKQLPLANCECRSCGRRGGFQDFVCKPKQDE